MLYKDLVHFTPIETIIQIRDANQEAAARHLVQTYVISETMANKLIDMVFSQLQFDKPQDNKGVLVVGNYGTGKSHLVSMISAIAERKDLVEYVTHPRVQKEAAQIAGRFKVIRVEIGSVTRGLREILLEEIQSALESWGVSVHFPEADQLTNNKALIIDAVAAFQQKYPDMGILLVVDEMLDYLRTREERAMLLDLGFLRELGEVAAACQFRFIGSLQETLFENPRFSFVVKELRRVKDRFEQVSIAREDITFVVSQRLLSKSPEQKAKIDEHLRAFAPLYRSMAERMDEFVSLFPIHPNYVETFETLAIAERRQVLKTFSQAISMVLEMEVPTDQPGLISYDHYWKFIQDDQALRSIDDIARVIDKGNVLEGLIRNAYTRPNLKDMAIQIIRALCVQRLSNSDVFVPLGVTAEGLRDGLCLHLRLPPEMNTAEFLLDQVQVALKEIMKTVQGQFLSYNSENGQYYIDLQKVVDFDQKIQERGEFMDRDNLDTYFFDALRQALNLSDTTYLTGHRIWSYEMDWETHKITRPGYLFFGQPDERTTAQPPRDFYLYFVSPFQNRTWQDQKNPDEVIFYLSGIDSAFEQKVRLFAGARAMANESTEYRGEYSNLADVKLRELMRWLRENLTARLHVIYQGVDEPINNILQRLRSTAIQNLDELLHFIGAHFLETVFEERYPEYPTFKRLTQPVTENARANSAMEAIRYICGRGRTALGLGVLEGLQLMNDQQVVAPHLSPYARHFTEMLLQKDENQVVNRGEVIEIVAGGLQPVEKDIRYHLEPEWVVVVLLALVYNGDLVVNLDGKEELDAASLERASTRSIIDLVNFRFFKRPRTLPLNLWGMIFEGLGLQTGLIRDENTRVQGINDLQSQVNRELQSVVELETTLRGGPQIWNATIFTDRLTMIVEEGTVVDSDAPEVRLSITELQPHLGKYKQFLELLAPFNSVGRLRNLRLTAVDIQDALDYRRVTERAKTLLMYINILQPQTTYLAEAQANLPDDHPWVARSQSVRSNLLNAIRRFGKGEGTFDLSGAQRELNSLKQAYIEVYTELHRKLVLTARGDDRRQQLYKDERYKTLRDLAKIDLLAQNGDLEIWNQQLTNLLHCREFQEGAITSTPTCPYCHLRPVRVTPQANAEQLIAVYDDRLTTLLKNWRRALRDNLASPTAQSSLDAMTPAERKPIEAFLAQPDETTELPPNFVLVAVQALRGIQAITLPANGLLESLRMGGLPCTREELQNRFKQYLDQQMRGHDASNTRLTLDQ